MPIIKRMLLLALLLTPIISISASTSIQKYFKQQKFNKILTIITEHKNDKIKDAEDHRICGETSYMFGMYKESCFHFSKVESMDVTILKEEDLIHYAFSLMKTDEYDKVLTKPCFNTEGTSGFWLKHMVNVAKSHNAFREKKSGDLKQNPIDIKFLSQYGVDYFDQGIYYSFPRFSVEDDGMLSENTMINTRRNELAGIRKTTIRENGTTGPSEIVEKKLAGTERIATIQIIDNENNFVSTVVALNGKPERIVVQGKMLPNFPFNSKNHACAMPYFDKKSQRLYFCSDMDGGTGGWDIYFTELKDGKWQAPVNLDDKVNTPFDELFPSVSDDLLIFSSEAREGLGGFDNYAYSFTDGSVTNLWPFNTTNDDLSLKLIRKEKVQAVGVNLSKAKFFQSELNLEALLNPIEKKTEEELIIEKPIIADNPQTSNIIKKEPELVINNIKQNEIKQKTDLSQISVDGDVLLGKIFYELNSAVFRSTDYAKLDSIASAIRKNGTKNIIIWSFTDRCGAENYNGNLSFQRALGIAEYLKSKFTKTEDKVYFSVAAGEYYSKAKSDINTNDRRADIFASEKGLPYQIVYAYKPNPGETAKTIANTFNNDYEMMSQLNIRTAQGHRNDEIVFVGIQGIHVTSPGESLYGISQKYGCSFPQLLEANHKTKISLLVAEKLVIPLPSAK